MKPIFLDLYEDYQRNRLDRREFLKRLIEISGGTAAAVALIPLLESQNGYSQVIPENDNRLKTGYIQYPGHIGSIKAYQALPEGNAKLPAIIVIHENRGLQPHIKDVARRVALEGFRALAPDALSGKGGTPDDPDIARTQMRELDPQTTVQNYAAAVKYLNTHPQTTGKVGCMGFCWGGGMTNQVAVHSPDLRAAVSFYGIQPDSADVPRIQAALLCHYGSLDERINAGITEFEKALKAAVKEYYIYVYEGAQHAFFNDSNPERFHKEASELAWKRTIAFFKEKLNTPSHSS